jgi:hypothetical protein
VGGHRLQVLAQRSPVGLAGAEFVLALGGGDQVAAER